MSRDTSRAGPDAGPFGDFLAGIEPNNSLQLRLLPGYQRPDPRAAAREREVMQAARSNPVQGLRVAAVASAIAARAAEAAATSRQGDTEAYARLQRLFTRKAAAALIGSGQAVGA